MRTRPRNKYNFTELLIEREWVCLCFWIWVGLPLPSSCLRLLLANWQACMVTRTPWDQAAELKNSWKTVSCSPRPGAGIQHTRASNFVTPEDPRRSAHAAPLSIPPSGRGRYHCPKTRAQRPGLFLLQNMLAQVSISSQEEAATNHALTASKDEAIPGEPWLLDAEKEHPSPTRALILLLFL